MDSLQKINIFWFRRDLRLQDNTGLNKAVQAGLPVLALFIFDPFILDKLEKEDARLTFIYDELCRLHQELKTQGSGLFIKHDKPTEVFRTLSKKFDVKEIFTNKDYEPYAKERDNAVAAFLRKKGIEFNTFKDQVVFEGREILTNSGQPYKVFTPYSKVWLSRLTPNLLQEESLLLHNFLSEKHIPEPPSLASLGFKRSDITFPSRTLAPDTISKYHEQRDFPYTEGTSRLGVHLRHGTISIRKLVREAAQLNEKFLNELIWREFYMMILDQNPHVTDKAFKAKYDQIPWQNNEEDFEKWCEGKTGIPIVDAGMRQLNKTGFMHNRIRMVVASFLTKNLLIDWRWGEAYFADKLLDYELSSNNGGWQWAAGSGVDAQPYFRVFNPETQAKTWDPEEKYIRKWVREYGTPEYPAPMVDLKESRARAIAVYKKCLNE